MELSRHEYPALLATLQPTEAVTVLNNRVKLVGKINSEIADWLQERRRIEEAYVTGLRKLASKRQQDASTSYGIFQTSWQSIVSSIESLAQSHSILAQKMELDVERPLREYQSKNREMQAMTTIQGNLAAIAKELEGAQKRLERQKGKSGKSAANKVSSANSDVENASSQWESQAPYVFEQLQALDEARSNHLRDVLTQLQTHEADQIERNRVTAESCLNVLLNLKTEDEISTFVARTSGGRPIPPRQKSKTDPAPATLAPPTPSRGGDDNRSEGSASKSGSEQRPSGLRRLGTVMGGRRKTIDRASSPERRARPLRNPLRRATGSKDMQQIPSPSASAADLSASPAVRRETLTPQPDVSQPLFGAQSPSSQPPVDQTNGDTIEPLRNRIPSISLPNGAHDNGKSMQLQENQKPANSSEATRDSEGFSVPSSAVDDITRAQQEAATSENEAPQFKLDIRNEPTHDEDRDAQTALSNVANTLRAQAQQLPPQRKTGTLRGRRDVRNTVFIPSMQPIESVYIPSDTVIQAPSPLNSPKTNNLTAEDIRGSDTQSVRSSHSMSSLTKTIMKHPEMRQPGLNASIVESVSAWFSNGQITKGTVMGELALVHNATDTSLATGSESIRLENFPVLEKVAPNPTFVNQIPSRSGEYMVSLSQIPRTAVAFKYQVHLEEGSISTHAPIVITPSWKVEATQTSAIVSYAVNPGFVATGPSVSLSNVTIVLHLEHTKAVSCQSKPVGNFSKEKSLIYWRLGDVSLSSSGEAGQKLLARFTTESEGKAGHVEARWEIGGEAASRLGSGLSLSHSSHSREEGSDPFADDGAGSAAASTYHEVPMVRRLTSGKYVGF